MDRVFGADAEWLETDGLGGFASGTVSGVRTRRYHALLLAARTPPTDRFVLVNGLEVWAQSNGNEYPLCAHCYDPGTLHPAGFKWIESFTTDPWPTWVYRLDDRTRIQHEVFVPRGWPACVVSWKVLTAGREVSLRVRPLLTVRDYHSLHHENAQCNFHAEVGDGRVSWQPYWHTPRVRVLFNGSYTAKPDWYRSFLYSQERARGLDAVEDCASPGEFSFVLRGGEGGKGGEAEACMVLSTDTPPEHPLPGASAVEVVAQLRTRETERRHALSTGPHPGLSRAADAYIVQRGLASTIIAGYPWFTDWGRDTFLSMRGLCLATGRLEIARQILIEWSRAQVEGLLPNRFPDAGEEPEFHSVDAALWFVQAAHDFLALAAGRPGCALCLGDEHIIRRTCVRALRAYAAGTQLGIGMDADGLLRCGEGDSSLTWMDARVDGQAITPRVGKPVEIQALWINALKLCATDEPKFVGVAERAHKSFLDRFWQAERGYLCDVVDVEHELGTADPSLRPNQVLAVGGLTHQLVTGKRARSIVDVCERELLTPMGLRTLGPKEEGYVGRYVGGVLERDGAYHNGTAWPWLMGPFVEAWVRVRHGSRKAKREARQRFLEPMLASTATHGLGHIAEIADGDEPWTPRGCPFQAWSVAEALRLDRVVLDG
ncbi:glycogen debranching enzyme-related protein [hydrothermal vent metagenome]|uniref:Glycogen debranching enzyme-related protein n=1 Tax=hydrothermal vent metagenome TaxID=652676 RepID=A0A3B1DZ72_9ZZZZ